MSSTRTSQRRSNLRLPQPPAKYDPTDQATMRKLIEDHWHPDINSSSTPQPSLNAIATVTAADDSSVTVTITAFDPYPQGAGALTLGVTLIHNTPGVTSGGVAVTTASTWDLGSGDQVVFVILRASTGGGEASVEWSLTDKNGRRTPDYETITVIERRAVTHWFNGTGAPSSGTGSDGDYYLDNSTGFVYNKVSGAWTHIASIMGPSIPVTVTNTAPTGTPVDGAIWVEY